MRYSVGKLIGKRISEVLEIIKLPIGRINTKNLQTYFCEPSKTKEENPKEEKIVKEK